jgi:cysteine synthase
MSAFSGIGNTPLVELTRLAGNSGARVVAKMEWANPTGSMKDRMAQTVLESAIKDGRLAPGDTVVEYTAGTTGISLAFACAVLGHPLHVVFSDAFSEEKRRTMLAFGAIVEDVPSDGGRITSELVRGMISRAGEIASGPGNWWCDQLNNRDAITGYLPMGEEIWAQTNGQVDAFVHSVGTAHSIHGVGQVLRGHNTDIQITAVEPRESPVLSGGASGANRIEGIGIGIVPPLWKPDEVDEIMTVSADEALEMARRLTREEGLFAGTSSGANVVAALRIADRLGPGATVATILCDSGFRYLSTEQYQLS